MSDFETMRNWLATMPGSSAIRRARLYLFDLMRYQERYEELYNWMKDMGWED